MTLLHFAANGLTVRAEYLKDNIEKKNLSAFFLQDKIRSENTGQRKTSKLKLGRVIP